MFEKLFDYHVANILDEEDLGRVVLRKEVLFFHQVLEDAIDHLLQALFAMNYTYFPSRKRSEQYIKEFKNKPIDCYQRICGIIENSISDKTIKAAVTELRNITLETMQIGNKVFKEKNDRV